MSRVLCLSFLGLMIPQKIRGELLYEDVIEAKDMEFGSLESGIMKINPKGPLNLLLGFLAHKLGLDYNMRMYFEEIDPKFKNDKGEYERYWRDDKGVGELGNLLIDLFPSHGGSLSVSSSGDTSFYTSLTKGEKGRDKGVKFLAALMVYSLGGKLEYKKNVSGRNSFVSIGSFKIENLKMEAGERAIRIIEYLRKPDSTTENMPIIEKFVKSKRFLLLSFVFMFLDNNREMKEFLNTFFSLADKEVREKCFIASKDYKDEINYELLGDVVEKMNLFPFSELNPPPSNVSIHAYSRSKDDGKGGFLNVKFSDCAEISLLEFVCCVFFNPETLTYPIDKLQRASPDLKNFFSTRKSLFGFDIKCRKEWFKVVQDRKDKGIEYVGEFSGARNEIEPGFLNLLSIFVSIWNPDDDDILKCKLLGKRSMKNEPEGSDEKNRIIEKFEEVFRKIVSIINSGKKKINIEYSGLNIGTGLGGEFWDIYGSIILTIEIKGRFKAKIKLEHSEDHADTAIIETKFPEITLTKESLSMASNLLGSDNELYYLIGKYISNGFKLPSKDQVSELIKKSVYNAFCNGSLNNDDLRLNATNNFSSFLINSSENSVIYQSTREITSNIIANSALSDDTVRKRYRMFFFIDDALLDRFLGFVKKDEDKTQSFIDAVSSNIGKSATLNYLKRNYESIFESKKYSTPLVTSIVCNNREDLFKIIEESQGEKYPGLSIAKVSGFSDTLKKFTDGPPHIRSFAKRLFNIMSKDGIIVMRSIISLDKSGLEGFLQMLKESGNEDIDREKQEKLFCYYFYAYYNDSYSPFLEILIKQTWNSQNFPIEYVSDCIVKRPNIRSCGVYAALLKLILERSQDKKIELGEHAFAIIEHVVNFILDDENKDEDFVENARPLTEKLNELLNEVKRKGLIRSASFNKKRLMELATKYLKSAWPEGHFVKYLSDVNRLMK